MTRTGDFVPEWTVAPVPGDLAFAAIVAACRRSSHISVPDGHGGPKPLCLPRAIVDGIMTHGCGPVRKRPIPLSCGGEGEILVGSNSRPWNASAKPWLTSR